MFFVFGALFVCMPNHTRAAYQEYLPGTTVVLGEFVYDDDFIATTTDNCSVSVYNPSGSLVVDAADLTAEASGWHHYSFTPASVEGVWPAFISCGTQGAGDLVRTDKTFIVTSNIVSSSSVASLVNANTDSTLLAASSSIGSLIASVASSVTGIPAQVWSYSARTLSSFGTLVADVWSSATRTLTGAGLSSGSLATQSDVTTASSSLAAAITAASGSSGWTVDMSDFNSVLAGGTYRARIVTAFNGALAAPASAPEITIYDADRNTVVSEVAITALSTGVYEYTYSVSSSGAEGTWESVVNTEVESDEVLQTSDYWEVVSAPAQVLVQSMSSTEIPSISANVKITNEGSVAYEYQYEWCVVSSVSNACGGGDDTYYASAAKLIQSGADFDTTLLATVPVAGTYYFKVVAYFGTESSVSSRQFTASAASSGASSGGGGGGGGLSVQSASSGRVADLNGDSKVNGVDFSILLAYWKSAPPVHNPGIDMNSDGVVDSIDFSILLYRWDK